MHIIFAYLRGYKINLSGFGLGDGDDTGNGWEYYYDGRGHGVKEGYSFLGDGFGHGLNYGEVGGGTGNGFCEEEDNFRLFFEIDDQPLSDM